MHCNDAFASKKKVMVLKLYYKSSWVQSSAIRGLVYSVLNILTRCKFRNKNTTKDNYTININFINTSYSLSSITFINKLYFLSFAFLFPLRPTQLALSLRYKSYNIFEPTFVL